MLPIRGFGSAALVSLLESINTTRCINQLLLAGEEGVAIRTDFDVKIVLHRRFRLELITAGAHNGNRLVFGMNLRFHLFNGLLDWKEFAFKSKRQ